MDVWIGVLALVLTLGFLVAVLTCIKALDLKTDLIIKSRLHHRLSGEEVIYANVGLVGVIVLIVLKLYLFIPAILLLVAYIVLSALVESGILESGALVGTTLLEWDEMQSYKLVDEENDSNIIILKIRANRKQYVLICDRRDRKELAEIFESHEVAKTKTVEDEK